VDKKLEFAANVLNAASILLAGINSTHTWWVGILGCLGGFFTVRNLMPMRRCRPFLLRLAPSAGEIGCVAMLAASCRFVALVR